MTSRLRLSIAALFSSVLVVALFAFGSAIARAEATPDPEIVKRFEFLSQNGNSSCSRAFRDSILDMPVDARLQGSCCMAMDLHRYSEQIEGLKQYAHITDVPPDPYDVAAPLARKLLLAYEKPLGPEEQKHYDFAMENSNEKGPCCCQCWRWEVFGGLGKLLIREHGFTGEQVTQVWNLSDGCGGEAHLHN
ncbi:hypothetical protein [Dongia deserti]|uniref:hypothetical protein n=1 Tax=Dongia deserti TaxID=2268030 RepID=UPI0013C4F077|nr:hypothetical protein [Dongia deserti]